MRTCAKSMSAGFAAWIALIPDLGAAPLPVLQPSDVVFMYQASREIYRDYGATVLAWGGTPRPESLAAAEGLKFFGSVGMVTEFSRYYERFPETYEAGLCRDLEGKPYQVPWLTDHSHKGIPYWWCCTRQPQFRQYVTERVVATVKAGAYGVHIDDHLGTAGSIFLGGCFCERCVGEFPAYLERLGADAPVKEPAGYDFRQELRRWLAERPGRKAEQHPLWNTWRIYQFRGAADFMAELRRTAAATAGRPVAMSANACLLWGPHLSDHETLDFFSAEIDHHASGRSMSFAPVVAYRIADAVERPLASTASGGDWAFIKAQNLPGLVRGWIALGYASGHSLMAPNRQWCYTPEKGTHWYEGPREKFAPLYRFARDQAEWLDGWVNRPDVVVVYSQRTYDRNASILMSACEKLAAQHLSFKLALVGDEIVARPFPQQTISEARALLVLEENDLRPGERADLARCARAPRFADVEAVVAKVRPAVHAPGRMDEVRILPRVQPERAVVHLVNWSYDAGSDDFRPRQDLELALDLEALGVSGCRVATFREPGRAPRELTVENGRVRIPELGLWGLLNLRREAR